MDNEDELVREGPCSYVVVQVVSVLNRNYVYKTCLAVGNGATSCGHACHVLYRMGETVREV